MSSFANNSTIYIRLFMLSYVGLRLKSDYNQTTTFILHNTNLKYFCSIFQYNYILN